VARVLGVSCYFHDAAAVRVEDGALVLRQPESTNWRPFRG
jgi:predicted NodU family carbamoyl transferase